MNRRGRRRSGSHHPIRSVFRIHGAFFVHKAAAPLIQCRMRYMFREISDDFAGTRCGKSWELCRTAFIRYLNGTPYEKLLRFKHISNGGFLKVWREEVTCTQTWFDFYGFFLGRYNWINIRKYDIELNLNNRLYIKRHMKILLSLLSLQNEHFLYIRQRNPSNCKKVTSTKIKNYVLIRTVRWSSLSILIVGYGFTVRFIISKFVEIY